MSTRSSNDIGLKKPIGIYILALLFIIAPLGNILISFAGAGVSNWYEPSIFFAFLQSIPVFDWAWLGLLLLTGVLLFRPHKLSWSFAIVTLILILSINAYRMFSADPSSISPQYLKVFSILSLFCTLGVLMIAFYFRFPYLDRRANWMTNVERFELRTEVQMNKSLVLTESISASGCKILTNEAYHLKKQDAVEVLFTEIYQRPVKCIVIESNAEFVRLEFSSQQEEFISKLKSWIKIKTST